MKVFCECSVLLGQALPAGLANSQLKCQHFTAACSSFYLCFSSAITQFCYLIFTRAKLPFKTWGRTRNKMKIFLFWQLWQSRNSAISNTFRRCIFKAAPDISSHHCDNLHFFPIATYVVKVRRCQNTEWLCVERLQLNSRCTAEEILKLPKK